MRLCSEYFIKSYKRFCRLISVENSSELEGATYWRYACQLIACIFLGANQAFSQSASDGLFVDNLSNNAVSQEIVFCSEITEVNEQAIAEFFRKYFSGWRMPKIVDGANSLSKDGSKSPLFVFSDGSVGDGLRACFHNQFENEDELKEFSIRKAQSLGGMSNDFTGSKLSFLNTPVLTFWSHKEIQGRDVVVFMSIEEEPYRTNLALTFLFGLDVSVCEHSAACKTK